MRKYVLDINSTDDLSLVIRKCNTNFKALASQQKQQDLMTGDSIDNAFNSLLDQIEDESEARSDADDDIIDSIDTLSNSLAAVATSGDFNDLINTPPSITIESITNAEIDNIVAS